MATTSNSTNEAIVRLRAHIDEAIIDPKPSIPAKMVFARLREHHASRLARDRE
jgi:hypothetical protein